MDEELLHFVWIQQAYNHGNLATENGQKLSIVKPGYLNTNAGPDFFDASVLIDELKWVGHIEIHIKASDWFNHKHHLDRKYDSTILHVVWENDRQALNTRYEIIPTLSLKRLIDPLLLRRYQDLLSKKNDLPCSNSIAARSLDYVQMLDKAMAERIHRKTNDVILLNEKLNGDWNGTFTITMASAFGSHLNQDLFVRTVRSIPPEIMNRIRLSHLDTQAVIFGQAGFLKRKIEEHYYNELQKRYSFLSFKHNLEPAIDYSEWNFHRTRPANFPTRRLAQLATFLTINSNLVDQIVHLDGQQLLKTLFAFDVDSYWQQHHDFGKLSTGSMPISIGENHIHSIAINAIVPLLMAFSKYLDDHTLETKAISLLESLPTEKNRITRKISALGFKLTNSAESQGALELYSAYCRKKRCLACNIGRRILNQ